MPEKARIHYVITKGGGAPNVVPDDAESWYFVRSPQRHQVDELIERVNKIAQGAALMTETTLDIQFLAGSYNYLPNKRLTSRVLDILNELGPLEFSEEEVAFAQTISRAFPDELRQQLTRSENIDVGRVDDGLIAEIQPMSGEGEVMPGSTDVSDVSWIAPTAQLMTTCFALGTPGHSWAITATSGMSIGHKGMLLAAKAMAIAAADAIVDSQFLAEVRSEFVASTAGRPFMSPIPTEVQPRNSNAA
ncbi:MAG: peptidase dimerization domain-containing protein, partial [Thermomicrobiales bacterium]